MLPRARAPAVAAIRETLRPPRRGAGAYQHQWRMPEVEWRVAKGRVANAECGMSNAESQMPNGRGLSQRDVMSGHAGRKDGSRREVTAITARWPVPGV